MRQNPKQSLWRIWDPPIFPTPPVSSNTHSIMQLKQLLFAQKFIGDLTENPFLNYKIESSEYQRLLASINQHINKPYIYYLIAKCTLTLISLIACASFVLGLSSTDAVWTVVSGFLVLCGLFCIRFAGNLYFKAMLQLSVNLEPLIEQLQQEFLSRTSIKIFLGQYCSWLEFTNCGEAAQRESLVKVFKVFCSGDTDPKGSISLSLI